MVTNNENQCRNNEAETKKTLQQNSASKNWFFKKIWKIYRSFTQLTKIKGKGINKYKDPN